MTDAPQLESWQEALTRRVRTLVRTAPLHALEQSKGHRTVELGSQDLRSLALRVLDVAIEGMGLGHGCDPGEVLRATAEMVRALEPVDEETADQVARVVLEGLLNERERRVAFTERYVDWQGAHPVARELQYHLVREEERPDGTVALRATTEGINLYTGMLDFDVQDAQIAQEAVLRAQIRRGKVADAVRTARNARLHSIELQQRIEGTLRLTRRDVTQVRWQQEVLGLLAESLAHLQERIETERELQRLVAAQLDAASTEDAPRLAELRQTLDDCLQRHMNLHRRVLGANREFLEEQERQAFRPRPLLSVPDLEAEVLRPALARGGEALLPGLEQLWCCWLPAHAHPVFDLTRWVDRLLAPSRPAPLPYPVAEPLELEELQVDLPFFAAEELARATALLEGAAEGRQRLSELLERAGDAGEAERVQRAVILLALQSFDPRVRRERRLPFTAELCGRALAVTGWVGDDLQLGRPVERAAREDC